MSTNRIEPMRQRAQGFCRGCGEPVGKGRRTWCSQACVDAALIKLNPGVARFRVLQRDSGVCASCGFDALKVERIINRLRDGLYQRTGGPSVNASATIDAIVLLFRAAGIPGASWSYHHHLWEADHIVPVVEGGGGCELENYRTLCLPCHRRETRALASRRAEARRLAKMSLFALPTDANAVTQPCAGSVDPGAPDRLRSSDF